MDGSRREHLGNIEWDFALHRKKSVLYKMNSFPPQDTDTHIDNRVSPIHLRLAPFIQPHQRPPHSSLLSPTPAAASFNTSSSLILFTVLACTFTTLRGWLPSVLPLLFIQFSTVFDEITQDRKRARRGIYEAPAWQAAVSG